MSTIDTSAEALLKLADRLGADDQPLGIDATDPDAVDKVLAATDALFSDIDRTLRALAAERAASVTAGAETVKAGVDRPSALAANQPVKAGPTSSLGYLARTPGTEDKADGGHPCAERTAAPPDVVERVARAICSHKGISPDAIHQVIAEPYAVEDAAGRRYIYGWQKQIKVTTAAFSALRPGDELPAGVVVPHSGVGTIIGWHDWMVSAGRNSDAATYAQVLDVLGLCAIKGGDTGAGDDETAEPSGNPGWLPTTEPTDG